MKKYSTWLLLLTLLAWGVRLHNLTYHSLWFDEAISVRWAGESVPRILEVGFTLVEDRLPPLYYLLLKGWANLFGFSEFGARSLSVFLGVLLTPVMATIATILFNRRVALLTALLVALNPFLVWYSQETRMYALAALLSALAVWTFLMGVRGWGIGDGGQGPGGALRHWPRFAAIRLTYPLLFIFFAVAGLYTHLYTGFLLPALGLWLIMSYPRAWRVWLIFALGVLLIALAFAPLAIATWRFSGEATPGDPLAGLGQRAWWLLQAFTLWKAPLSPTLQIAIPILYILLTLAAFLPLPRFTSSIPFRFARSASRRPLLLVVMLFISPFAIATLLLLRNYLAFFGERYFIMMVPWLLLLAAFGAERVGKWLNLLTPKTPLNRLTKNPPRYATAHSTTRLFTTLRDYSQFIIHNSLFALLLLLAAIPLPGQWSIPAAKEAWRQSVVYLAEHAAAQDGILIHPDWVRYPFQFYFRGPGQTYAAFSTVTPKTPLDGPLQGVVNNHPVIWLIQSHLDGPDPQHLVEQWLARRYPLITELYPPGISLKGYAPTYRLAALPVGATPVQIQFENGLQLVGYQVDRVVSAADPLFHPPSGWVHLTLYWTAARPIAEDATPFVNLMGPEGVWGASLERTTDALKMYPTSRWFVGQTDDLPHIIRHDIDVNLNPVTPPGVYQLVVGLRGHEQEQYSLTQIEVRP